LSNGTRQLVENSAAEEQIKWQQNAFESVAAPERFSTRGWAAGWKKPLSQAGLRLDRRNVFRTVLMKKTLRRKTF
jgi:hypothetical protein